MLRLSQYIPRLSQGLKAFYHTEVSLQEYDTRCHRVIVLFGAQLEYYLDIRIKFSRIERMQVYSIIKQTNQKLVCRNSNGRTLRVNPLQNV